MRIRNRDAVFVEGAFDIFFHIKQNRIVVLVLAPCKDGDLHAAVQMIADIDLRLGVCDDQVVLRDDVQDHAPDLGDIVFIADGIHVFHAPQPAERAVDNAAGGQLRIRYLDHLVVIGAGSVIPEGVTIGKNTAISGITEAEDYPDGALPSGGYILKKEGKR